MRIVSKDENLREKERVMNEMALVEKGKRDSFLQSLRENRRFQEYVVNGIFKKQLDNLTDIRNIPNIDLKNPAEAGNLLFQATAARKTLEKILSEIS